MTKCNLLQTVGLSIEIISLGLLHKKHETRCSGALNSLASKFPVSWYSNKELSETRKNIETQISADTKLNLSPFKNVVSTAEVFSFYVFFFLTIELHSRTFLGAGRKNPIHSSFS